LTIVCVITMPQSSFKLDEDNETHMEALKYGLGKSYSRVRFNLHLHNYKKHFKGINLKDSAAVANAIAKARATFSKRLHWEQWALIYDSFETPTWKVNLYSLSD
jgi:hypothetical protein